MKAMIFTQYGSIDSLHLEEVAKPTPKDNEVLIKVCAVSINSWDLEMLNGIPYVNRLMAGIFKPSRIKILGCDIAGQIEAVGKNIKQFQVGDAVFGDLSSCGWGGLAEYVCAPETALIKKPATISYEQAAATPQAGLLALQGLCDKGNLQPGEKVLINGASGGTGSFAVSIAKSIGAEVTGVCRTQKMDFVRELGADHIIDYTQEDFTKNGHNYDLILDVKGSHSIFDYKRALSNKGRYVMAGGVTSLVNQVIFLGPFMGMISGKKMGLLLHKANKDLDAMVALIESGKVSPVIDRVYSLEKTADAFHYFDAGNAKGKVVITIGQ